MIHRGCSVREMEHSRSNAGVRSKWMLLGTGVFCPLRLQQFRRKIWGGNARGRRDFIVMLA